VIIRGMPDELILVGQGGSDTLRADGTGVIFGRAANADVAVVGNAGADTAVGGNGDDTFTMESVADEPDSVRGGGGKDFVTYSGRTSSVSVTLNDVADDGSGCPATCEGDDIGKDVESVGTGSGSDQLIGGPGHQELSGGGGADVLRGGDGPDTLSGGEGPDDLGGGKGFDFASYSGSFNGVVVTIDGDDDDGVPGEHDNVKTDVEGIFGSFSDDHLTGNGKDNDLFGAEGDDELRGAGGDDLMDGGHSQFGPVFQGKDGSDEFFGGPGRDTVTEAAHVGMLILSIDNLTNDLVNGDLTQGVDNIHKDVENVVGGPASDLIVGSGERNVLSGGKGNDKIRGLGGDDVLKGQAGNDQLNGGSGRDKCELGPGTGTKTNCEV
jgi:Ca2+-binding RTX toxin-like protein